MTLLTPVLGRHIPAHRHCSRQPFNTAPCTAHRHRVARHSLQQVQAASRPLESCQQHDVLQIKYSDGSSEYVEVLQGWNAADQSCQLLWKGQLLQLVAAAGQQSGALQLKSLGGLLVCTDWMQSVVVCL